MRVEAKSPVGTSAVTPRKAAGSSFTLESGSDARGAASASATSGVVGIDALLVLQGEGDAKDKRRRAARHGSSILDALDRLKADLLAGRISAADLSRLRTLLRQRPDFTDDAGLEEVLAHIELRAEVELAKLGR